MTRVRGIHARAVIRDDISALMEHPSAWLLLSLGAVILTFFILDVGYEARSATTKIVHHSDVSACYRGVQNQSANAESWYADYEHELVKQKSASGADLVSYQQSAETYLTTAKSLNVHTYGIYSVTWPFVSVTAPSSVTRHYPLGQGQLNCPRAFPNPASPFIKLW